MKVCLPDHDRTRLLETAGDLGIFPGNAIVEYWPFDAPWTTKA